MTNSFEALFGRGSKKDEGKKTATQEKGADVPEKEGSELEKAASIKKEISEITQGRSLEDLEVPDLRKVLGKYKEMETALGLSEVAVEGSIQEQLERAREILGDDVFASEQIEKAFGIKIKPESIPNIPFSESDLERAKELNQFLVLRVDKAADGKPLSLQKINEIMKGEVAGGSKLLYSSEGSGIKSDAWYKDEDFIKLETPKLSWSLTSTEVIPNSKDKNYLDQTAEMVDYLKNQVFKGVEMPKIYQDAIKEFEKEKDGIGKIISSDWKNASEKLINLKISQITRQNPAEALYDIAIYFQNKGERLLENMYTWTSRRASDGRLVHVGGFDSDGAEVVRFTPDDSRDRLGVSFSRSL